MSSTTCYPRVYDFMNPLAFIRDCYERRKTLNSNFNLKAWSLEMGLAKPDLVASILKGKKRLRPRYVDFMSAALGLDASEEIYFKTLIIFSNSQDEDERSVLEELLSRLTPGVGQKTSVTTESEIVSDWRMFAVATALHIEPFQNEALLIDAFSKFISADEIKKTLKLLERHGVINFRNGKWEPLQKRLITPNEVSLESTHEYYRDMLKMASTAISVDLNHREFQFCAITISEDDLAAYKDIVREFRLKMASRAIHTMGPDSLYQLSVQFFPLVQAEKSYEHSRAFQSSAQII